MALTIRSAFGLPASPESAWAFLTDIERAAPCFPGASLQGQDEDGSWKASFLVKLGPMAFTFAGKFRITSADAEAGRVVISAQGTDTKGRGGAAASVDVTVAGKAQEAKVNIVSSVDLSGSVAQFGRGAGMIQALSQQLVNQFAANLAREMADAEASTDPGAIRSSKGDASLDAGGLAWRALRESVKSRVSGAFGRGDKPDNERDAT